MIQSFPLSECPLNVVAKIARDTIVPMFRDGLVLSGELAYGSGTFAYPVQLRPLN